MFEDKILKCRDCGAEFTFTASEQQFYADKGFQNEPSRCKPCRDKRKQAQGGAPARPQRQMFTTTCADCGRETQVPFEPRQGKPVYCRDCYNNHRYSF